MSVLFLITEEEEIQPMLAWGRRMASALTEELLVLVVEQATGTGSALEVPWDLEHDRPLVEQTRLAARLNPPQPRFYSLGQTEPLDEILALLRDHNVSLLTIGKQHSARGDGAWKRQLLDKAPCHTMTLRSGPESGQRCNEILLPVAGGPHCRVALKIAEALAVDDEAHITALYIEPDFGEGAEDVGIRIIQKAVRAAGITAEERIRARVLLADDVTAGIAEAASEGYDLVLVGASNLGFVRRTLFGTIPERLLAGPEGTSIAVIRSARPLHRVLREAIESWLRERVPQLERADRIDLFERLQVGSSGGFDFIALTCLATFIASIGLIQNSTAVVIGAMLVAPLMTPMIGAGLGLVQGNIVLVRDAARSIGLGFLLAFGIGVLSGALFGGSMDIDELTVPHLTAELTARGHPGLLDLIVALASGVAAAYANARSNLSSALPGVAIAAALVPPIATGGIALAVGELTVAREAVTLFGTNLVAIVLGSALALYLLGIRGNRDFSRSKVWARRALLLLIIATLALAFFLGSHVLSALR